MKRYLKVLGLTLSALMAMAVVASPASALFQSETESTTLTVANSSIQKFEPSTGGSVIECWTLKFDETTMASKLATTITAKPTISGCSNFLGQSVAIDSNGCQWVFHLAGGSTLGSTDFECPGFSGMTITVGSICTYEIDTQTGIGGVSWSNKGAGTTREIEVSFLTGGLSYTRTTNHFFCPAASSFGGYRGSATLTGESGGNHVGVFVD